MDWAMTEKSYSQRRACALAGIDPRVYRRRPTRPEDEELRERLRELSGERRRFGYDGRKCIPKNCRPRLSKRSIRNSEKKRLSSYRKAPQQMAHEPMRFTNRLYQARRERPPSRRRALDATYAS